MTMEKKKQNPIGLTRREFLKNAGATSIIIGTTIMGVPSIGMSSAAKRDYILIGRPAPLTGALADFGEGYPLIDNGAVEIINRLGGIYIKEYGKKVPVKVKVVDTESNPVKAANVASSLILEDKVDLMLVLHTPETVNPVSAVCEKYEIPCICMECPIEPWLEGYGRPYKWCYHAFWRIDTLTDLYIDIWDEIADHTNKVVGGFWADDSDGLVYSDIFKKKLPKKGYKVIDPGRFPLFKSDFSEIINLFKKEKVEIVTSGMIPPDWATAWRQCRQMGFTPKVATIAKAILFPSSVNALGGNLASGLTAEVWWSPFHPFKSSLTGQSARDFCEEWVRMTGKQWVQPIGFDHAAYEIAYNALKRAGTLNKLRLRDAVERTDLNTIVGHIKYNQKHYSETPLVGGQWVKGEKYPWDLKIISNKKHPEIPTTAKMVFPIPK